MEKKTANPKPNKRRTQAKKLTKSEKKLSTEEAKKVKGGVEYHKQWQDGYLR